MISSDTSVALNRRGDRVMPVRQGQWLGAIVLDNGRFAMGKRLKPVLEAGREAGLLEFDDAETAFRTFFGLVARDVQIRLLLGDRLDIDCRRRSTADAARATRAVPRLFTEQQTRPTGPLIA